MSERWEGLIWVFLQLENTLEDADIVVAASVGDGDEFLCPMTAGGCGELGAVERVAGVKRASLRVVRLA